MSREIIRAVSKIVSDEIFSNDEYKSFRKNFEIIRFENDGFSGIYNVWISFTPTERGMKPNCALFDVRCDSINGEDIIVYREKFFKSKDLKDVWRNRFRYIGYDEANQKQKNN